MAGLLAKKLEMTRVVKDDKFIPITLLEIPELRVVDIKTTARDGYEALVIGVLDKKAEGKLKDGKVALSKNDFSVIKEFPLNEADAGKYNVGDTINLDNLEGVALVNIVAISKGKGFAGAMKKHNFHGGPGGHGSKFHRALGSIGNRKPTRTHKGKKMHGHMGNVRVQIKKVPVELVNKDISIVGVRGGVPGGRNSIVSLIF